MNELIVRSVAHPEAGNRADNSNRSYTAQQPPADDGELSLHGDRANGQAQYTYDGDEDKS
jgi:hypothetical protein